MNEVGNINSFQYLKRQTSIITLMKCAKHGKRTPHRMPAQWILFVLVLLCTSNVIAGDVPDCVNKTHKIVIEKTIPAHGGGDNYVTLVRDYIIHTKLLKNSGSRLILLNDITVPADNVKFLGKMNTIRTSYNIQTALHRLRIGDVKSARSKIVIVFKMGMFWHEDHSLGSEYNVSSHLSLSSIMNRCLFVDGDNNLLAEVKGRYTEIKPEKEGVTSCDFTLSRESAQKLDGSDSMEVRVVTDKIYNWLGNNNREILSRSYPATLPDEVSEEVTKVSKSLLAKYESKKCRVQ